MKLRTTALALALPVLLTTLLAILVPAQTPPETVAVPLHNKAADAPAQEALQQDKSKLLVSLDKAATANDKLRPPAEQLYAASLDIETVAPELRQFIRYLNVGNKPLNSRQRYFQAFSGHFNGLSSSQLILPPGVVAGTFGSLLRINLNDYHIDPDTWEQLVNVDYVFHEQLTSTRSNRPVEITEEVEERYWWPPKDSRPSNSQWYNGHQYYQDVDGKWFKEGWYTRKVTKQVAQPHKPSRSTRRARWVEQERRHQIAADTLEQETGSQIPIINGDLFFNQTAINADRVVGYYKFLGVSDRDDWERKIGFSPELSSSVIRSAIARSGVTVQPRAYVTKKALWGDYHLSIDFRQAIRERNPLAIFGQLIEDNGEAFEAIGFLPNHMLIYALFNGQGQLVDSAPDFIASDSLSKSHDRRVHVNMSCIRCHTKDGFHSYDCYVRSLMGLPEVLQNPNFRKLQLIAEEYTPSLELGWGRSRELYEAAVKLATGLSAEEYSKVYGEVWSEYEDAYVDLARAELDTGIPKEVIKQILVEEIKQLRGDPVLSVLTYEAPRVNYIPIRQWEEKYGVLQLLTLGIRP